MATAKRILPIKPSLIKPYVDKPQIELKDYYKCHITLLSQNQTSFINGTKKTIKGIYNFELFKTNSISFTNGKETITFNCKGNGEITVKNVFDYIIAFNVVRGCARIHVKPVK